MRGKKQKGKISKRSIETETSVNSELPSLKIAAQISELQLLPWFHFLSIITHNQPQQDELAKSRPVRANSHVKATEMTGRF